MARSPGVRGKKGRGGAGRGGTRENTGTKLDGGTHLSNQRQAVQDGDAKRALVVAAADMRQNQPDCCLEHGRAHLWLLVQPDLRTMSAPDRQLSARVGKQSKLATQRRRQSVPPAAPTRRAACEC